MLKPQEHFHGSDLEKIEQVYHIKKEDITSFSANVNPLGVSPLLKKTLTNHIDSITSYPDREYTSLRKAISQYTNTDPSNIVVGNGSTELISLFIQIHSPKSALLLAPTYSEYEREISLCGGTFDYHYLQENNDFKLDLSALKNQLKEGFDLLVLCNPNNPTSTALTKDEIVSILTICRQYHIFVIIDETYIEFTPDILTFTAASCITSFDNLVILRGISKFFAAPGLRLGYAICGNADLLSKMNQIKNPWTINSLAAIAGEIMFSDKEYMEATKQLIDQERTKICQALSSCKFVKYYNPMANFFLLKITNDKINANIVFETCIKKGLMIRDCSTFAGLDDSYFRFCIMSPGENDKLLAILTKLLND